MGGAETEISDSTTNVLLEAAAWNFINIRKTSHAQRIFTEAGTRFARNIHPTRALLGNQRGIELMRQIGGGKISKGVIDVYPLPPEPIVVHLPISEVHRLLGVPLSVQETAGMLSRLQFDVAIKGDALQATVPEYRTDISSGIVGQADLVEEVARVLGYDQIPTTIIADAMPEQLRNRALEIEEHIRDLMSALGLTENICYRFTTPEAEAQLTPDGASSSLPKAEYVTLLNPIASDKTVLRHTLLRNLLHNAINNARFNQRQQIFEIGNIYLKQGAGLPQESGRLAMVISGARQISDWTGAPAQGDVDFYDLKGVMEGLMSGLHIREYSISRSSHSTLHPGRAAALHIDGQHIGDFGELHPRVVQNLRWEGSALLVAELDLDTLIALSPDLYGVEALPVAPPVLEDLALVVPASTAAADVEAAIRKTGGKLLRDVRLFDVYTGESIGAGNKSLAYALTYQSDEKTLADKDVKKIRERIIYVLERELGAKLRS
jgi:phenylalanyl-tRNA synthetase beta chain